MTTAYSASPLATPAGTFRARLVEVPGWSFCVAARKAIAVDGALTTTVAVAERELAASDTVSVCEPVAISVIENVPTPFVSVESGGNCTPAEPSLLLKWTVPLYDVTGAPWPSTAVTVTLNAVPVVAVAGADSVRPCTPGAPFRKAAKRFAVVCWMRASARPYQNPSSARLHEIVPDENTH